MCSTRHELLDIRFSISIAEYAILLSNRVPGTFVHIIVTDNRLAFLTYIDAICQQYIAEILYIDNDWMFYRLALKGYFKTCTQEEMWKVVYKMKNKYLTRPDMSLDEIYSMQDCCHYLNTILSGWGIKIKSFLNIMSRLRERRLRIAKKKIYYFVIKNVICNPEHPVGRRLILKEYNMYANNQCISKLVM